ESVGRGLASTQSVLPRRVVPPLDGAFLREAARALQEELDAFPAALPAHRDVVTSQSLFLLLHATPLGRPAAVVWYRGHVANRRDIQTHGLQRPDRRLPAGARTSDVHLHLLQAELHRFARRVLRGGLGGEGRALSRALESGATGARPGHDVSH